MKTLLLCHGNTHDLHGAGFLTISDIRSGNVLTMDIDEDSSPDFLQDFSKPVSKVMKDHLGSFDTIYPVFCPGTEVIASKKAFVSRQAIRNLEALLKPGGKMLLHTTLKWYFRVNGLKLAGMPPETYDRIQEEYNRETNEYNHKGMADALRKALVGSRLRMLSKAGATQYSVREETRLVIVKVS